MSDDPAATTFLSRLDEQYAKALRERDEAKAARDKAWEALRLALADAERLEAERDRLREALLEIRDRAPIDRMHDIAREALAREDDNE